MLVGADQNQDSTSITFFCRDGISPLHDPSLHHDATSENVELPEDICSPSDLDRFQSSVFATSELGNDLGTDLDDGIFEVYGPPARRPRSVPGSDSQVLPSTLG